MWSRCSLLALLVATTACGAKTGLLVDASPEDSAIVDSGPPPCRRDRDCDDGVECTEDRCDRGTGVCFAEVVNEACDDLLFCNGVERCDRIRGCLPGTSPCGDAVMCTVDTCEETLGCLSTPDRGLCPISHRCDVERGCQARALAHFDGDIFEVDLPSGETAMLLSVRARLTDLALAPDRRLFGTTAGSILEIDLDTGMLRTVTTFEDEGQINALDADPGGVLWTAAGRGVFRVDPDSGRVERVATLDLGLESAGDLAFLEGRLVMTVARAGVPRRVAQSDLYEVDAITGVATPLGPIGFTCVWGLAALGSTLYGLTCEGRVLEIDGRSGAGTQLEFSTSQFWGATAR